MALQTRKMKMLNRAETRRRSPLGKKLLKRARARKVLSRK